MLRAPVFVASAAVLTPTERKICVGAKVLAHDGGTGEIRIWKNNILLDDVTDTPTLTSNSDDANAFYLFTFWNGNAPASQHAYIDDLTLTTITPSNHDAQGNVFIGGY